MSTRCNIIVNESGAHGEKLYFYRHSDGYPEGAMPLLVKFVNWMREGKIRNNIVQAPGWLIVLGAIEYSAIPDFNPESPQISPKGYGNIETIQPPGYWKCGSIEPTTDLHGNIEYIYTIDLKSMNITIQEMQYGSWKEIPAINIAGYKPSEFVAY